MSAVFHSDRRASMACYFELYPANRLSECFAPAVPMGRRFRSSRRQRATLPMPIKADWKGTWLLLQLDVSVIVRC